MKTPELIEELKKRGLATTGNRNALEGRLKKNWNAK